MPPAPRGTMSSTGYRHSRSSDRPRSSREHSNHDPRWHLSDSLTEHSGGACDGSSEGAILQDTLSPSLSSVFYLSPAPYSTAPYSTSPYSTAPYSTDRCLSAQSPRCFSGASGLYSSAVSGLHLGYDFGQSASLYTPYPAESRDEWYDDDTEQSYTSVTHANNRWRHEHKRGLTILHPSPQVSASMEGVPEWLLRIQHHKLFPSILQAWTKFINPASRGSSSGRATASLGDPPFPPSDSALSSRKRKKPSGRGKTSPEDTKDPSDGPWILEDEESAGADGPERRLACHYYKSDAARYEACRRSAFKDARSATQHLRNKHKVTLQQLPWMPAKEGPDESQKWYWTWRKMFPGRIEPDSPYHDPFEVLDQFIHHFDQQGHSPEIISMLRRERLIFASRSTDRRNDTPQPNASGTADMHTSPLSEVPTPGSSLLPRTHPADQSQNRGAGTDADPINLLRDYVATEQLPPSNMASDEFQPNTVASEDQGWLTPTELGQLSEQHQHNDTAFASGPSTQFSMPYNASKPEFHDDGMYDPLADNLQGNSEPSRNETQNLPPHAWDDRNTFDELTFTGSRSLDSVSEGYSHFDEALSGVEQASGTNPSTVSNGNAGEQSCYEWSEMGEGELMEDRGWWV